MKTGRFYEETSQASKTLEIVRDKVSRTIEMLERLLNAEDEVEIREWCVRCGKVFITFESPVEIEHVPADEKHLETTLIALFPTCNIEGTRLEIEASELL